MFLFEGVCFALVILLRLFCFVFAVILVHITSIGLAVASAIFWLLMVRVFPNVLLWAIVFLSVSVMVAAGVFISMQVC